MQLRQNRRAPGRYREDDIPELPSKPTAVEPRIPFDPTLRPAAFPTLEFDQFYTGNIQETKPDTTTFPDPQRPALIFRDCRTVEVPIMSEQSDDPGEFYPRIGEEIGGQPTRGLAVSKY